MKKSEEQLETGPEPELERGRESGTGSMPWVTLWRPCCYCGEQGTLRQWMPPQGKSERGSKEEKKEAASGFQGEFKGWSAKGGNSNGKGKEPRVGCFMCGGPHTAANCPEGGGKRKGYGMPKWETFGGERVERRMDSIRVARLGSRK